MVYMDVYYKKETQRREDKSKTETLQQDLYSPQKHQSTKK